MSLIFNPPAYKVSGRIAHWCPNDAMRMYKDTDNSNKYQQKPELLPYNRAANIMSARGNRQSATYESHIFTKQEADKITSNPSKRHEADVQYLTDNATTKKTTTTIARNVYHPLPNAPRNVIADSEKRPAAAKKFKGSYDPNRHDRSKIAECDIKSIRDPMETKVNEPKGYYGPTPKHLPNNTVFEQPKSHVVTLDLSKVSEKFNIKDYARDMASKGHVVMDTEINNNPITNKRTGNGRMHVRVKTKDELDAVKANLNQKGIDAQVSKDYKPTWH